VVSILVVVIEDVRTWYHALTVHKAIWPCKLVFELTNVQNKSCEYLRHDDTHTYIYT